jgi:hypothetical protein
MKPYTLIPSPHFNGSEQRGENTQSPTNGQVFFEDGAGKTGKNFCTGTVELS